MTYKIIYTCFRCGYEAKLKIRFWEADEIKERVVCNHCHRWMETRQGLYGDIELLGRDELFGLHGHYVK